MGQNTNFRGKHLEPKRHHVCSRKKAPGSNLTTFQNLSESDRLILRLDLTRAYFCSMFASYLCTFPCFLLRSSLPTPDKPSGITTGWDNKVGCRVRAARACDKPKGRTHRECWRAKRDNCRPAPKHGSVTSRTVGPMKDRGEQSGIISDPLRNIDDPNGILTAWDNKVRRDN